MRVSRLPRSDTFRRRIVRQNISQGKTRASNKSFKRCQAEPFPQEPLFQAWMIGHTEQAGRAEGPSWAPRHVNSQPLGPLGLQHPSCTRQHPVVRFLKGFHGGSFSVVQIQCVTLIRSVCLQLNPKPVKEHCFYIYEQWMSAVFSR